MHTVLTIGTFDGVHVGHRALIGRARGVADAGTAGKGRVVVLAFDPHPLAVLRPGSEPARLTPFEDRGALLRSAGADSVVRLDPAPDLLALTPGEFIRGLVRDYSPMAIVEGPDFRFGRGRAGDVGTLSELGGAHGFACHIVPEVEVALTDLTMVGASSSICRWLLENGRVRDAAIVLGRAHSVRGRVVRGDRRGRELGFPTANLRTECMVPGEGVYAGTARLPDGRGFAAAIHVGPRPTFNDPSITVEAHLLGLSGQPGEPIPGLPEYDWALELSFISRLRDQAKFDSVGALVAQMHRDCARAASLLDPNRSTSQYAPTIVESSLRAAP